MKPKEFDSILRRTYLYFNKNELSNFDDQFITSAKDNFLRLYQKAPKFKQSGNKANFHYAISALAIYLTIKDTFGKTSEEALIFTKRFIHTGAKNKIINSVLSKLSFYFLGKFKWVQKLMLKSQTALIEADGWKAIPVGSDAAIAFDVYQCGICEYLKKNNAIILAEIFCELDMIGVEYMPGLMLERKFTIAQGNDICDFRYKKTV